MDLLRVVALAAVVAIHSMPFESSTARIGPDWNLATVVNQLCRFAVPYFFVISGFFWAGKIEKQQGVWPPTLKTARRILFLFAAWSVIYVLVVNPVAELAHGPFGPLLRMWSNLKSALYHPVDTLFEGTAIHLWFLMALLWCLFLGAALVSCGLTALLVPLGIALYAIGLLGKPYADSPFGIQVDFNFRNGPFFGLLFFVTGFVLHKRGPRESWFYLGWLLVGIGGALHFAELWAIHRWWGTTLMQDYLIGTYFAGLGVSMVALARPGGKALPLVSLLGPLALGAYVSHYVFIKLLWTIHVASGGRPVVDVLHFLAVFILSFATSYGLSRWRWTRALVT